MDHLCAHLIDLFLITIHRECLSIIVFFVALFCLLCKVCADRPVATLLLAVPVILNRRRFEPISVIVIDDEFQLTILLFVNRDERVALRRSL